MNFRPTNSIPIIALAISVAITSCKKAPDPCTEAVRTIPSPSGKYEAKITIKTCGWGFGLAAESVELKVSKLGQGGWFYTLPIEFDSINRDNGCPPPTINWTGPNELHVLAVTRNNVGRLVRHDGDLSIIREYALQTKEANRQ